MKHTISLTREGYIEIILIGPVVREHVTSLGQHLVGFYTQLEDSGKDLRMVIDSLQATNLSDDAYSLSVIILKTTPFTKTAIIENRKHVVETQTKNIEDLRLVEKIRVYTNRMEAMLWLEEKK